METYVQNLTEKDITHYLPHRFPFLMVDRIEKISYPQKPNQLLPEVLVGAEIIGYKKILNSEPCFQGHFPGYPIFPGVLSLEAMAQVSGFVAYPFYEGKLSCVLVGVDAARFRKPIFPECELKVISTLKKMRVLGEGSMLLSFECQGYVAEKRSSEAEIMMQLNLNKNGGST